MKGSLLRGGTQCSLSPLRQKNIHEWTRDFPQVCFIIDLFLHCVLPHPNRADSAYCLLKALIALLFGPFSAVNPAKRLTDTRLFDTVHLLHH